MSVSRRDLMKLGGLTAVGAAAFGLPVGGNLQASTISLLSARNFPRPYAAAFVRQVVQQPTRTGEDADGKWARYDVYARPGNVAILPTLQTPLLGYYAAGLAGQRIDVDQGTRIELAIHSRLPANHPTFGTPLRISTHLHGANSLPQYDGYASDVMVSGQRKVYKYANRENARTMWYHDHGVHYTAQNAYSGLAAQYHLHDEVERALLPRGEYDVAITLTDMIFRANGSQLYDDRGHSGLWGDVILVNAKPWPVLKVKPRIYRFRVLNACSARSFQPTLSRDTPMHMVATDGGLMPATQSVLKYRHSGAERYEFLVDFSKFAVGQRIEMRNLSNPNNRDYDHTDKIMAFDVVADFPDTPGSRTLSSIPSSLRPGSEVMGLVKTKDMRQRRIRVERQGGEWTLNGETWDDVISSGFKKVLADPDFGATEVWTFENKSGGWYHPMHTHMVDFKILSRNGKLPFAYERGPKDTVYVGENESVELIMKFGPHRGRYMVHCHNLAHEDHDMMHQFSVGLKDLDDDPNHPINADPPVLDDDPGDGR